MAFLPFWHMALFYDGIIVAKIFSLFEAGVFREDVKYDYV